MGIIIIERKNKMKLETSENIILSKEEFNILKNAMDIVDLCECSVRGETNYHYSKSAREAIEKFLCIITSEIDKES